MKNNNTILLLIILLHIFYLPSFSATSNLTLTSGNTELNEGFIWAKAKALSYVATGRPGVPYPCYQGSYPWDPQYCIRDISHQVEAGHLLGLDVENFSMLKRFVVSANNNGDNCRKRWTNWKFEFTGPGSTFTPELPTPFELAERSYEQYMWTGDNKWIIDPEFSEFFNYTNNTLVSYLDGNRNGIVDIAPMKANCNDGLASYWEFEHELANEAGDALGAQYQSYLSYAKILEHTGSINGVRAFNLRAQALKEKFENEWFIPSANRYASCFLPNGDAKTDWAHEQSVFLLLKRITDMGPRTVNYIDFVHSNTYTKGINIETTTYYPEAFYHHNANHIGWHWLLYGYRSRNDYPEVSFLAIRNTICGLMGVSADAPNKKVITLSKLVNDVPWVEVDHIPVGQNDVKVRHDGLTSSTFKNNSGDQITWEAQFYGEFETLNVDGVAVVASTKNVYGKVVSFVDIPVAVGQSVVATAGIPLNRVNYDYLSDLSWTYTSDAAKTRKDICQSGYAMTLINPADNSNTTYAKGIGMQNSQEIRYNLDKKYYLFSALLGLDVGKLGTTDQNGKVTFKVFADGVEIFNGDIVSKLERKQVVLNVEGVNELKLVTVAQQYTNLYPTWADAKVYNEKTTHFNISYNGLKDELNPDGQLNPGETANLSFNIANMGYVNSGDNPVVTCELLNETATYATVVPASISSNTINANSSLEQLFSICLAANTPKKTRLEFKVKVADGNNTAEFFQTIITPHPLLEFSFERVEGTQTVWPERFLEPGNSGNFVFKVKNNGTDISDNIRIVAESKSSFLTISNSDVDANPIGKGESNNVNVSFAVNPNTPNNTKMVAKFSLYDKAGTEFISAFEKEFFTPAADYRVSFVSLTNLNNGFSNINPGTTSNLVVEIENIGSKPGSQVFLNIAKDEANQGVYSLPTEQFNLNSLAVGAKTTVTIPIVVNAGAPSDASISMRIEANDGTVSTTLQKYFVCGSVYLSDMPFETHVLGFDKVYRDLKVMGSRPISLGKDKIEYLKGLGVHSRNVISFQLDGKYNSFKSDVGIDASITAAGSCVFKVFADNTEIWTSNLLVAGGESTTFDLNVSSTQVLKLEVTDGGDGMNSDHANWGNARLTGDFTNDIIATHYSKDAILITPTVLNHSDPIIVKIHAQNSERSTFDIYDKLGKVCYSTSRDIVSGTNHIEITNAQLSKGMYFLKVSNAVGEFLVEKFIIK